MTNSNPPINPDHTSLSQALAWARATPALDICVDYLDQVVHYHEYTGHPDDECAYESCMRGDLEVILDVATTAQEVYEEFASMLMELPEGHRAYPAIKQKFDELVEKYGTKSK